MKIMITRNHRGFTLIEVVVVLVLISIIAATVFTRSITTDQINISAQTEKIKSHIRYAQSMAMKRSAIWGIRCASNEYWFFSGADPDNGPNQEILPGEQVVKISLDDLNLTMDEFTVFFDRYGKPYVDYSDESSNSPLSSDLTITVSGSHPRNLTITPETGLIRNQ
jgi:prepilin-type N-terminal cleavage/methylation domain-containing protein